LVIHANYPVKRASVIAFVLYVFQEISGSDRSFVRIDLYGDIAHFGFHTHTWRAYLARSEEGKNAKYEAISKAK
jgi:hypothetical protein